MFAGMIWLVLAFAALCWAIAVAPKEVTQAAIVLVWAAMAVGCMASVASTLAR
jgi:hypothetical protein